MARKGRRRQANRMLPTRSIRNELARRERGTIRTSKWASGSQTWRDRVASLDELTQYYNQAQRRQEFAVKAARRPKNPDGKPTPWRQAVNYLASGALLRVGGTAKKSRRRPQLRLVRGGR